MVPRDADELPASMAFRGGLYRLFECGHIVRCYRRAWKSRSSGEVSDRKRERWLTTTQRPKRIALHSGWSRRAIAIVDLAAQGRWLCFRVVCRGRIIRGLCGQGLFYYPCTGIAGVPDQKIGGTTMW